MMPDGWKKNIIFVGGKGGVGKTAISQALALSLAQSSKNTLWVEFENPNLELGTHERIQQNLTRANLDPFRCFEEYAELKIAVPFLTKIFLNNSLIQVLARAAPGFHELVLLGKVLYDANKYDHVVVDMPAMGHGIAIYQSAENFSALFKTGPLHKDAEVMIQKLRDPAICAHLVVALPEEMPLIEGLELGDQISKRLSGNIPHYVLNRQFPPASEEICSEFANDPTQWESPLVKNLREYAVKRTLLERENLKHWRDRGIEWVGISLLENKDDFPTNEMDFTKNSTVQDISALFLKGAHSK
jgi:anion-transporting  ArsA/GET3 family ATPase